MLSAGEREREVIAGGIGVQRKHIAQPWSKRKGFLNEKCKLARLKGRMEVKEVEYISDHRERRAVSETCTLSSFSREGRKYVCVNLSGSEKLSAIK